MLIKKQMKETLLLQYKQGYNQQIQLKNNKKKSYCCNTNRGFPLGAFLEMNPFVPVTDSKDSVSAEIKIKY